MVKISHLKISKFFFSNNTKNLLLLFDTHISTKRFQAYNKHKTYW